MDIISWNLAQIKDVYIWKIQIIEKVNIYLGWIQILREVGMFGIVYTNIDCLRKKKVQLTLDVFWWPPL